MGIFSSHKLPDDVAAAFEISNAELTQRLLRAGQQHGLSVVGVNDMVGNYFRAVKALDEKGISEKAHQGTLIEMGNKAASALAMIGETARANLIEDYIRDRFDYL